MEQLFTKAALTNALSGALADVFTTLVLYPLDIVKLRTQACRDTTWQDVVKDGVKSPLSLYVGTEVKVNIYRHEETALCNALNTIPIHRFSKAFNRSFSTFTCTLPFAHTTCSLVRGTHPFGLISCLATSLL